MTTFIDQPTPHHPEHDGDGTRHSPLRLSRLPDGWGALGEEIQLGPGTYEAPELTCRTILRGAGMDRTVIKSVSGSGVLRGKSTNTLTCDLTLECNEEGTHCNGWSPTGDYNFAKRVKVRNLWTKGKHEAFGFLPYGNHCKVCDCVVEGSPRYATAFCPVGENIIMLNNHADLGNGERTMGYALYNTNGWFEQCTFGNVRFGFYGDVGGHDDARKTREWGGTRIIQCGGVASEATFRIEALHSVTYRNWYVCGGRWEAPKWVSFFNTVKDDNGKVVDWNTREYASGWHWDDCEFEGGPHFQLPKMPGCSVTRCSFSQQPVGHEQALPFLFWSDNNSHTEPVAA